MDQESLEQDELRTEIAELQARVAQLEEAGRALLAAADEEAEVRPYASMTDAERDAFRAVLDRCR